MTPLRISGSNKNKNHLTKVLIVDDHDLFRRGLRDLIGTIQGMKVVGEAASSQEALSLIDVLHADLVLLDLSLADGNALALIHTMQSFTPAPKVIVLSATLTDEMLLFAMLSGASGYLTKDLMASEISRLLSHFLKGGLALAPASSDKLIQLLLARNQELEAQTRSPDTRTSQPADSLSQKIVHTIYDEEKGATTTKLLAVLTPQEEKIYRLMKKGRTNKEIAAQLAISRFTVGKHVQNILHKLNAVNRTQAVSYTAFEGDGTK